MESSKLCERCKNFSIFTHFFSCNHFVCSECILRIIAFTRIKTLLGRDQIQITCPCHLGMMLFPVNDIPQLLSNYSNPASACIQHGAIAKFHCLICKLWLCEECIEVHRIANSDHQLTQGPIDFQKCDIHYEQLKDHYCHDCHEVICPLCTTLKQTRHFGHKSQIIKDYASHLKTQIPVYDDSAKMKHIEEKRADFRMQVDLALQATMKNMDQLIQLIEESRLIYHEKIKQTLYRADIFFNLLKFCYSHFNKSQAIQDIHLLYDLSTWDKEFSYLELKDETENKLKKLIEDYKECSKIEPVEAIHAVWVFREWSKNPLTLIGHNGGIYSLIQMNDGRIASGSYDSTIKIWEEKEKEFLNTLTLSEHKNWVCALLQLRDGRLASAAWDMTIKIWQVNQTDYKNTVTIVGHPWPINALIQMKDGRIASAADDNTIRVWEMRPDVFKNTATLCGHKGPARSLIQMHDGRLASVSWDAKIKIWEVYEKDFKKPLTVRAHKDVIISLIQLKDGRLVTGSGDHKIKIWEVTEKEIKKIEILEGHTSNIFFLIELKDGRIASASVDNTIKIWEETEHKFINTQTLIGHEDSVYSLLQLKDGRIASGSNDRTIKIWE